MYPILLRLGSIEISSYGLFLALAFMAALSVSKKRAKCVGLSESYVENSSFWLIIAGILGARFLHVFVDNPQDYVQKPWMFFYVWQGGLSFTGGLLGAIVAGYWICRKKDGHSRQRHFLNLADLMMPSLALGLAIGKIGCLLMGCCHGSPTNVAWAVRFTHPETLAMPINTPVHPSQIYESLIALAIFIICSAVLFKRKFVGQVFVVFLFLFALYRLIFESLRANPGYIGQSQGMFTTVQYLSMLMLPISVILYIALSRKNK